IRIALTTAITVCGISGRRPGGELPRSHRDTERGRESLNNPFTSLFLCGSVADLLPLNLEIALVEIYGGAANLFDLAIHARQFVEHDLEDVAIIFVRASERIEPVGEDPAAQRQGYFMPVMVGQNPAEAAGEAVGDTARPGHGQPDSQRRG